jgi:hypothetical protein
VPSGLLRRVVWQKFTEVSQILAASIIRAMNKPRVLMMETASTPETSADFY